MLFFFYKQKTAYEMRISDWSSDVCSSDLVDHHAVDAVGARERLRGLDRVAVQAHLLLHRRIGPADVEAARRHLEVVGGDDLQRERVDLHRRRRLHRLGDRLAAHPAPGVAAHRPAQQRSEEHTSELQSLMRISLADVCMKKQTKLLV